LNGVSGGRYERRHEAVDKPPDNRSEAERDRDRILYSSAFRRLAGVTQVVAASEGHVFHNRLTHTLKVAQVARRIAEHLVRRWDREPGEEPPPTPRPPLDPDVVETAALAHDLGHPPFGHIAEKLLHQLMRGAPPGEALDPQQPPTKASDWKNGFEGNAQSFRIVTGLAAMDQRFRGLDLTRASLAAILKYPWLHDPFDKSSKAFGKWGAYESEIDDFRFALSLDPYDPPPTPETAQKTLEAQVMDWADDITYAVHDAEDLFRAGLVPLDRLKALEKEREEFADWVHEKWGGRWHDRPISQEEIAQAAEVIATLLGTRHPYAGGGEQRVAIRAFVSSLVAQYVRGTKLQYDETAGAYRLDVDWRYELQVDTLKELAWRFVIQQPALASQQEGQLRIIDDLFRIFHEAMEGRRNKALLPPGALEALPFADTPPLRARTTCDVICSLTEQEAVRLHARLTGMDAGSVIDPILLR
jgi:dGTPase